ncbi:MAG TPA: methyltransferase [Burkholderiaceae bacterium]|nr:methyltransferase [Burkholderiaceae bacterium]
MVLLIYYFVVFIVAFVFRSLLVYRSTGINPLVLPSSEDAYGYVGRAFKVVIAGIAAVIIALAIWPEAQVYFGRWNALGARAVAFAGWALLIASLVWLLIAQAQMGASWRIGIDKRRTDLVQHGLFRLSRNPIFLAMRVNLLGLFLVFPSAVTAALLAAGEILMQVQVRLEEQHLMNLHGRIYVDYQAKVRRWL